MALKQHKSTKNEELRIPEPVAVVESPFRNTEKSYEVPSSSRFSANSSDLKDTEQDDESISDDDTSSAEEDDDYSLADSYDAEIAHVHDEPKKEEPKEEVPELLPPSQKKPSRNISEVMLHKSVDLEIPI